MRSRLIDQLVPIHNNQRDGYHRQTINVGKVNYHRNSLAGNTPAPASEAEGGYVTLSGKGGRPKNPCQK